MALCRIPRNAQAAVSFARAVRRARRIRARSAGGSAGRVRPGHHRPHRGLREGHRRLGLLDGHRGDHPRRHHHWSSFGAMYLRYAPRFQRDEEDMPRSGVRAPEPSIPLQTSWQQSAPPVAVQAVPAPQPVAVAAVAAPAPAAVGAPPRQPPRPRPQRPPPRPKPQPPPQPPRRRPPATASPPRSTRRPTTGSSPRRPPREPAPGSPRAARSPPASRPGGPRTRRRSPGRHDHARTRPLFRASWGRLAGFPTDSEGAQGARPRRVHGSRRLGDARPRPVRRAWSTGSSPPRSAPGSPATAPPLAADRAGPPERGLRRARPHGRADGRRVHRAPTRGLPRPGVGHPARPVDRPEPPRVPDGARAARRPRARPEGTRAARFAARGSACRSAC